MLRDAPLWPASGSDDEFNPIALKKERIPPAVEAPLEQRPLRICLLSYRGNPYCGGQGVYIRNLSNALCRLGHLVDVVSGPPYPHLLNGSRLLKLPSLDLYNPADLFRTPSLSELRNPINLIEWLGVCTMGFPEPLTFGMRANRLMKLPRHRYDIVHDNQSLSYGVRAIAARMPTVATIHHAITVDREIAVRSEKRLWKKAQQLRWYSFITMQKRVAPSLRRIITVSRFARDDISRDFNIPAGKFSIVPNGIDVEAFQPLPGVVRQPGRLIVTTSSDTPLKGLGFLLKAIAVLAPDFPELHLMVVGKPKKNSPNLKLISDLGISDRVRFTGALNQEAFVYHYARSQAAVVPSLYEGFGMPAGEAMACAVPVISTTGGALQEVVGACGLLVPPADAGALADAIKRLLTNPSYAAALGHMGSQRVRTTFTWEQAALKTVAAYRRTINDYR